MLRINLVGRRADLLDRISFWSRGVVYWSGLGPNYATDRRRNERELWQARRKFRDMVQLELPEEWFAVDLKVERAKREAQRDAFLAQGFS